MSRVSKCSKQSYYFLIKYNKLQPQNAYRNVQCGEFVYLGGLGSGEPPPLLILPTGFLFFDDITQT